MAFSEKGQAVRKKVLSPLGFRAFVLSKLPLAAFSGMSIRRLDEQSCAVDLPGGWRTQNPFRSTYFAAQAMAAEMSTGAPAMVLVNGASASVSLLVQGISAQFTKKCTGTSTYTFDDVAGMARTVEAAVQSSDAQTYTARSVGTMKDGTVVSTFEITWTFKRRSGS